MPSNPKPSFNLILLIICVCLAACSKPKPPKPDFEHQGHRWNVYDRKALMYVMEHSEVGDTIEDHWDTGWGGKPVTVAQGDFITGWHADFKVREPQYDRVFWHWRVYNQEGMFYAEKNALPGDEIEVLYDDPFRGQILYSERYPVERLVPAIFLKF